MPDIRSDMSRIRIAYLSGPVDAREVHDCWTDGREFSLFGTSYLTQFFQLCSEIGAASLVVTTLAGKRSQARREQTDILNFPPSRRSGLLYHVATAWSVLRICGRIARFRPHAVILTAHQDYWFLFLFLRLVGVRIIPSAHCALWRPFIPTAWHLRALLWCNGMFLRRCVSHAMAISRVAADQMREISRGAVTVHEIKPTYARGQFSGYAPATFSRPMRILFAARVEANKGVFDLVEIARMLQSRRPGDFRFDICGEGSDLDSVRKRVMDSCLSDVVSVHGFCDRDKLSRLLSSCHVVIAPTRSDFEEGFNKSCLEAVLAHRPFISSPVCPAIYSLEPAAVVVPPDDVAAYRDALLELADNPSLYEEKSAACRALQEDYFEPGASYKATLRHILGAMGLIGHQMAERQA